MQTSTETNAPTDDALNAGALTAPATNEKQTTERGPRFNAEKDIKLSIEASDSGFTIQTQGMRAFKKPDLRMHVEQQWFVAAGTRIMLDAAEYVHQKPVHVSNGQRVRIAPWTVVEFRVQNGTDLNDPETLVDLVDGGRRESFVG